MKVKAMLLIHVIRGMMAEGRYTGSSGTYKFESADVLAWGRTIICIATAISFQHFLKIWPTSRLHGACGTVRRNHSGMPQACDLSVPSQS